MLFQHTLNAHYTQETFTSKTVNNRLSSKIGRLFTDVISDTTEIHSKELSEWNENTYIQYNVNVSK